MSTYDKASLVLIPSGTKEGVVFSQKPTNGDGDFTFTRASSATRVNSDGLIEKETQNLLTYSNDFSNPIWVKNVTTTGGQSGYDGSSDAWELSKGTASAFRYVRQSFTSSSGVKTASVYAKAGTLNLICLYIEGGSSPFISVNLTTGAITSQRGTEIDTQVTDVGNDWWRISLSFNENVSVFYIYPDWNQSNTGNLYIQDAQLNQGLVADSYLETTTAAVYGGITDNIPRLDYTDASCPSLKLEPQRTNIITQSEYFGDWNASVLGVSSIQSNYSISPEGVQNAAKVNFIVQADSDIGLTKYFAVTGGSTYTHSIYIKGEGSDIGKDIVVKSKRSGGDTAGTTTIQTLTADWVRVDFQTTYAANNTAANFYLSSNDASSVLVYGAQVEQSSYVTSYIPTYGASVTKLKDECSVTGVSDLIGQTEGTIYFNADVTNTFGVQLGNSSGGSDYINSIQMAFGSASTNVIVFNGGAVQFSYSGAANTGIKKFALAYKQNDFAFYIDGNQIITDNLGTIPSISGIFFNHQNLATNGGKLDDFRLYNTRLSNAELAELTS